MAVASLGVPRPPSILTQLAAKSRVPTALSGSVICLNSYNSGKCGLDNYRFIPTETDWNQREGGEVWEGPRFEASVSYPCGITGYHPPGTSLCDNSQSIANQERSPRLWCPEFLLCFSHAGITSGINPQPPAEAGPVPYHSLAQRSDQSYGLSLEPPS